ncbi:MAG TPA: flagellar filament capping protein FliD [Clostridia bacterium]|nr:flagellar filament capping protein FliD [Clostridia bacterium]
MATNSISNTLNARLRMTGLSSGLDIDGMITKLMKAEREQGNKLYQKKAYLEWQQDSYRSVTSLVQGFSSDCFDVLNSATNIRSTASFNAYKSTYNGAETSPYLTMTAGSGAIPGNYTISDIVIAKTAKATGGSLAGAVTGSHITNANVANISSANDNNKISVTFNGSTQTITLNDNPADVTALQSDLQSKLNAAFGNGKISVNLTTDATGGTFSFNSASTNTFAFNYAYNAGASQIFGQNLSKGITLDASNNKFKLTYGTNTQDISLTAKAYAGSDDLAAEIQNQIDAIPAFSGKVRVLNQNNTISLKAIDTSGTGGSATGALATADLTSGATIDASNQSMDITLNGVTKTITLKTGTYLKSELLTVIQSQIDSAFGGNKGMVSMNSDGKTLRFEAVDSTTAFSMARTENGGLAATGMANMNLSNKINMSSHLFDIKGTFNTPLNVAGAADDIQFAINGKTFKFDSTKTTMSDIITAVNADSDAGVTMKYDELNNRISVESKQTGVTAKVQISDTAGNLMASMGLSGVNSIGSDASFTYNDGSGPQTVTRSSNDFTINNIAFSLKADAAGPITANVASDPSKTIDLVKNFVTKYNTLIDKINSLLSEKKYSDYVPLTDDQKSEMKDADVTAWEKKAKSGLLKNDSILNSIVNNMRKALYDPVSGVTTNLSAIGISTGSYLDKGKLTLDETKLKAALAANPDQVTKLFTNTSDTSYSQALNDSSLRTTRYNESGLGQRLYDIIQDNIRTTRNNGGQKGALLEKAGISGDVTEFKNFLSTQIDDYKDRISDFIVKLSNKQTAYYNKFSAMETALNNMNSQSSWLSQQLGQG